MTIYITSQLSKINISALCEKKFAVFAIGFIILSVAVSAQANAQHSNNVIESHSRVRIRRQAENSTTPLPITTTDGSASTTPATTTIPTSNATTVPPVVVDQTVNISSIDFKNYTFVDHTSFKHSMNNYDFDGLWTKYDVSEMTDSPIPLPRPDVNGTRVESGGSPGSASGATGEGEVTSGSTNEHTGHGNTEDNGSYVLPDDNNFVIINYVSI